MFGGGAARGGHEHGSLSGKRRPVADVRKTVYPVLHDAVHIVHIDGSGEHEAVGFNHFPLHREDVVLQGAGFFTLVEA
jgi:hypothetical protein